MTRHLFLLCLHVWLCSAANAQTISDAFPDFAALEDVRHYQAERQTPFPPLFGGKRRPDIKEWIKGLRPLDAKEPELRISVYRQAGEVRFIHERSSEQERLYRISDEAIALVCPLINGRGLWENQLGIKKWVWKFDVTGNLTTTELYRWSPPMGWTLARTTTQNENR